MRPKIFAFFRETIRSPETLIRLLIGFPRISHTAEAFWALNILPFRKLGIFNVVKLTLTFKKDFTLSKNIKNANLIFLE